MALGVVRRVVRCRDELFDGGRAAKISEVGASSNRPFWLLSYQISGP